MWGCKRIFLVGLSFGPKDSLTSIKPLSVERRESHFAYYLLISFSGQRRIIHVVCLVMWNLVFQILLKSKNMVSCTYYGCCLHFTIFSWSGCGNMAVSKLVLGWFLLLFLHVFIIISC